MKRFLFCFALITFVFSSSQLSARDFNISSPIKLWLLTNEAKAISSLNADRNLISQISSPFSSVPFYNENGLKAEEQLWNVHRKIYKLLSEVEDVYSLAKRYGDGHFSVLLKRARPEIWILIPLHQLRVGILDTLPGELRKAFHSTLLECLQLNENRDTNLSERLSRAQRLLKDDEMRLMDSYLDNFSALYPANGAPKLFRAFIKSGTKQQFARRIKEIFKPVVVTIPVAEASKEEPSLPIEPDDPLAELEKLAEMTPTGEFKDSDSANNASETFLEEPDQAAVDMFNIWD